MWDVQNDEIHEALKELVGVTVRPLHEMVVIYMIHALIMAGTLRGAARELEVDQSTIYRRFKKAGVHITKEYWTSWEEM